MYTIYYIKGDRSVRKMRAKLAPSAAIMLNASPMGSEFVARYFPSRKAYRLYDLRKYKKVYLHNGKLITKAPKHSFENADLDAIFAFAALKSEGPSNV